MPGAATGVARRRERRPAPAPMSAVQAGRSVSAASRWYMAWVAMPPACGHSALRRGRGSVIGVAAISGSARTSSSSSRTDLRAPGSGASSLSPNQELPPPPQPERARPEVRRAALRVSLPLTVPQSRPALPAAGPPAAAAPGECPPPCSAPPACCVRRHCRRSGWRGEPGAHGRCSGRVPRPRPAGSSRAFSAAGSPVSIGGRRQHGGEVAQQRVGRPVRRPALPATPLPRPRRRPWPWPRPRAGGPGRHSRSWPRPRTRRAGLRPRPGLVADVGDRRREAIGLGRPLPLLPCLPRDPTGGGQHRGHGQHHDEAAKAAPQRQHPVALQLLVDLAENSSTSPALP